MATTTTLNTDPTINNSVYNSTNGRYVLGGTTEVSSFAIEVWDANVLPADPSDIVYIVEKKYEGFPHLLGLVFYGDIGLWWLICQYNGIIDPMEEIIEGKALLIPTLDRIKAQVFSGNSQIGGVPTTRSVAN
jgi:hypothetical protein